MSLPIDYAERVYAGVLGKIIGVYLGRPFEGWTYERIMEILGEVTYYVNDKLAERSEELWGAYHKPPLVVTDDDISGTFTFLRALPDYGNSSDITPAQIGQSWLNYIIENRTILWWGGLGNSTEHTAYLRLKSGVKAPESGAIALNGQLIAEQIGAQIFIDGWAMVAPGNPELAADLARRAASVSHDGEAIYASQVLAAMEAQAFVESDIDILIDTGLSFIPKESVIYRMISDIRDWHAAEPDWHKTRTKIASQYGYDTYGGNCHMVPNHALIVLGLLYGEGDFNKSMLVVNTAGWDTDCNSGNLGCLLGLIKGLDAFDEGIGWRGPVADRLFLPTADGGGCITDAVIETDRVVEIGRALASDPAPSPKGGARFHFEYPGSMQGFHAGEESTNINNVSGHSQKGLRSLAIHYKNKGHMSTPTFILPEELNMEGYKLIASPTLYAGQMIKLGVSADQPAQVRPFIRVYNAKDQLDIVYGPQISIDSETYQAIEWDVPSTHSQPIAEVGLECQGESGRAYLDYLTWDGAPQVVFKRPMGSDKPWEPPLVWRQAWIDGLDQWEVWWPEAYRLVQNSGRGLIMQGTRDWKDYVVEATMTPWLMNAGGIAARVQGMRRYYALLLRAGNKAQLIRALDGDTVLAEANFEWQVNQEYKLRLQVEGSRVLGWVNEQLLFDVEDEMRPLLGGGVAYVVEEGHLSSQAMTVKPVDK